MKKIIFAAIFLALFSFGLLLGDGLIDDSLPSDKTLYGIVYGNAIKTNGKPSDRLEARLKTGLELYDNKVVEKIIVSGGTGVEGYDEAKSMKEYLVENGVDIGNIIVDSDGYTTAITSQNSYELAEDIAIVGISQWFHIARVKLSLKQSGFSEVYGIAPKYFERRDFYSSVRECAALVKYKIKY